MTYTQLPTIEPKNKNKNKLSKQLEQLQNHRNADHMEGYRLGQKRGRVGESVQGIRRVIGRYKIDRGRFSIRSGEA